MRWTGFKPCFQIQLAPLHDGMWRGNYEEVLGRKPTAVSLVITHCKHGLDWLHVACAGMTFRSVTIYSKCGKEELARTFASQFTGAKEGTEVEVVTLANVGRESHTHAYHMGSLRADSDPEVGRCRLTLSNPR
jgi:hypothetical protein